jgi:Spy/CpxP family protein refolding chaperone
MKSKSILAAALLFFFATLVFAQEAPKDKDLKGPGKREMKGRINFTDEQRAKMKTFRFELQKKQVSLKAKVQTARIELKELLSAEKIDKTAIEKKLSEISKIQVDQKMTFINHWEQVNQILTPEQKEDWKRMLNRFDSPMKGRMMRHGGREGRFNNRESRGPGRLSGEIPEFDRPDGELASLFTPEFNNPGFDDQEEFSEMPFDSVDEFFEMENCVPEQPEINPPDIGFGK